VGVTELYIKIKLYIDSLTKPVSLYFWGDEYSLHRMYLNVFTAVFVVFVSFFYGFVYSNFYYFKLSLVLAFIDVIGIFWRYKWKKHKR
jgi:hypothetical protein